MITFEPIRLQKYQNDCLNLNFVKDRKDNPILVKTKYASAVPKNLGMGLDFRPCSEGDFITQRP